MNILEYTNQEILALLPNEVYDSFIGAFCLKFEYDNADKYLTYYLNREKVINNYDDYIDYLFLQKQCLYIKALPYIKDERKEQFEQTYKEFGSILSKYQVKDAIKYINKYYEKICLDLFIITATFHFIKDKVSGIKKEVFIEIAKKQPHIWYCNFKSQIKYLLKNTEIVDILFSPQNLDIFIHGNHNLVFENLLVLRKYPIFNSIFCKSVEIIISFMEEMEREIKQENIFKYRNVYYDFCNFLGQIKSPKFAEKQHKLEQYEVLLQKEILENGHRFSFEIKGEDVEEHLGKEEPKYEILKLTHTYDKENKKIVHIFENAMHYTNNQTALKDIFRGNIRQNEYFSVSTIEHLQLTVYAYTSCFNQYILKENRQQMLFAQMKFVMENICDKLNINLIDRGFINDILIIESALFNVFNIITKEKQHEKQLILQLLCYSLITYTCTFIEKLLREIYIVECKDELYIDPNSLTLGDLLSEQNKKMHEILGYDQVRCLRYFLHVDKNEVGENLRNRFAHFSDITPKDFQPKTALKIIWLLLGIMNSLDIHYLLEDVD